MSIIIDIKNAVRDAVYTKDNTINFNFNEIETVDYPYIFFYIPSFRLEKATDTEYWRNLQLNCVLEYALSETNNSADLWSYADTLADAVKLFPFSDTKISAKNQEFRLVDGVLQMTFDLDFYIKLLPDEAEDLMRELALTIHKENLQQINYTEEN